MQQSPLPPRVRATADVLCSPAREIVTLYGWKQELVADCPTFQLEPPQASRGSSSAPVLWWGDVAQSSHRGGVHSASPHSHFT